MLRTEAKQDAKQPIKKQSSKAIIKKYNSQILQTATQPITFQDEDEELDYTPSSGDDEDDERTKQEIERAIKKLERENIDFHRK